MPDDFEELKEAISEHFRGDKEINSYYLSLLTTLKFKDHSSEANEISAEMVDLLNRRKSSSTATQIGAISSVMAMVLTVGFKTEPSELKYILPAVFKLTDMIIKQQLSEKRDANNKHKAD